MVAITAWLYPKSDNANGGAPFLFGAGPWQAPPSYSLVDDPFDSPDDSDAGWYSTIPFATVATAEYDLTAPPSGVAITSVTVLARVWSTSLNGTTHDLTLAKGFVRPGGVGTRDKKTLGSGTIVGTTGAQGPNPQLYTTAAWATNPNTGIAWTIPDLQALVIGVEWSDIDTGSNTPRGWLSQVYAVVAATTLAQTTERFRAMGSAALRAMRLPYEVTTITTDAEFADINPGDSYVIDHQLGPSPGASPARGFTPAIGWGKQNWQRRDHICLSTVLHPELLGMDVEGWDVRAFRARLWGVFKHDLGYSDEAQGVAWLDSGGGRTVARAAQAGYVLKQSQDLIYAQVPADFPKWDPLGLRLEGGGDINRLLNSSFSQGAGAAFTNWTVGGTGSIAEDLVNFLFDATGLRRAAKLTQGAAQTETLTQTTASTTNAYLRARVIGNMLVAASAGDGTAQIQIRRSSDSKYWNNPAGTWDVAVVNNVVKAATVGAFDWSSKLIPTTGTNTYTVVVGLLGSGTNGSLVLQEVELTTGTQAQMAAIRSPLVTTTVAVTRVTDSFIAQNNATTRWWDPATRGGTILITFKTLFAHSDLADGAERTILYLTDGTRYEHFLYLRTNSAVASIQYRRYDGSTVYTADLPVGAGLTYLSEWKLGFRWIGTDGELGLAPNTLLINSPDTGGIASAASEEQALVGNTDGRFAATTGDCSDIIVKDIEALDFVLTDEEISFRLG